MYSNIKILKVAMIYARGCVAALLLSGMFDAGAVTQTRDMEEPCSEVFAYKGLAYFCAKHELYGEELHVTNGQEFGTRVVKDILPGVSDSRPSNFFEYREKLMFTACDASGRQALWSTDGTEAGTKKIDVLDVGDSGARCRFPFFLTPLGEIGGNFYFKSRRDVHFLSAGGEVLDRVNLPGPEAYSLSAIKLGNQLVVFAGSNSPVYIISQQGHVSVAFDPGIAFLASEVIWDGRIFYHNGSGRRELWMTNRTLTGGELVRRVDSRNENYRVVGKLGSKLVIYDPATDGLYTTTDLIDFEFIASPTDANYIHDDDLRSQPRGNVGQYSLFDLRYKQFGATYITDGTASGTYEANSLAQFSSRLIFEAHGNSGKLSSLGVNSNTAQTFEVSRNVGYLSGLTPSSQGVFFFAHSSDRTMVDLWVSTGTAAGTKFIKRLDRPPGFFQIFSPGSEGQRFYFVQRMLGGNEFWHSDGTSKGTYKLKYRFDDGIISLTEEELERMRRSASMVPVLELLMDEEE